MGWSEGLNMSSSASQTAASLGENEWLPSQVNHTISSNNTVSDITSYCTDVKAAIIHTLGMPLDLRVVNRLMNSNLNISLCE